MSQIKRKLVTIAILVLALVIGGTFAFTAFNQQVLNDRENDVENDLGGRVHDYYDSETENKDVFVENFGEHPIMVRIRLTEFLETRRAGEANFTPLVPGDRNDTDTWTPYISATRDITTRTGAGAVFNQYAQLTFGWKRGDQYAPWYLPTFNHRPLDLRTAAAGDARDVVEDGATHPGNGQDAYWQEGMTYTNGQGPTNTTWPGSSTATRETKQNLYEERSPVTLDYWINVIPNNEKIGDYWVMDHRTGWAYWASTLEVGETTSYLIDKAEISDAMEERLINGTYYYGIHVDSQLITPDEAFSDEASASGDLVYLLEGIRNNAVDEDIGNPAYNINSQPEAFRFHLMNPGRIFTMAGTQYRYLENMGNGNHMIIRNESIRNISWNGQDSQLNTWFNSLPSNVRSLSRAPAMFSPTPVISATGIIWRPSAIYGTQWLPTEESWNAPGLADVRADVTTIGSGTTGSAFALSFADVVRLSGPGRAFPTHASRGSTALGWWWLRTPGEDSRAAHVSAQGVLHNVGTITVTHATVNGGVRPALIIHQTS